MTVAKPLTSYQRRKRDIKHLQDSCESYRQALARMEVKPNECFVVLQFVNDSYAAGIWAGTGSHTLDIYSPSTRKLNSTPVVVMGWDHDKKTLTVKHVKSHELQREQELHLYFHGAIPNTSNLGEVRCRFLEEVH